ncbi:MAG: hypothetical protein Q7U04_10620 [Bacteriovorax sp.]|nr:hypothetical protein [Bacteriovorax sp.]
MKFLILNLLLSLIFAVDAKDCFETKTKIIFDKKSEFENIILCKKNTPDNMLYYVSKSCYQDRCEILKRAKINLVIKNYTANFGSPGFKLCDTLGGIPQIFDFQDQDKKWQTSERCFFGQKDFVEISLLTSQWKESIR